MRAPRYRQDTYRSRRNNELKVEGVCPVTLELQEREWMFWNAMPEAAGAAENDAEMDKRFTERLRQKADSIWEAQHQHLFVRGIGDGDAHRHEHGPEGGGRVHSCSDPGVQKEIRD